MFYSIPAVRTNRLSRDGKTVILSTMTKPCLVLSTRSQSEEDNWCHSIDVSIHLIRSQRCDQPSGRGTLETVCQQCYSHGCCRQHTLACNAIADATALPKALCHRRFIEENSQPVVRPRQHANSHYQAWRNAHLNFCIFSRTISKFMYCNLHRHSIPMLLHWERQAGTKLL